MRPNVVARRPADGVCANFGADSSGVRPRRLELRLELVAPEAEEAVLVAADLVEVDVGVAGLLVLADVLEIPLRIRPTGNRLGNVLGRDLFRRLLEVRWPRELIAEVAAQRGVRPDLAGCLRPLVLARRP